MKQKSLRSLRGRTDLQYDWSRRLQYACRHATLPRIAGRSWHTCTCRDRVAGGSATHLCTRHRSRRNNDLLHSAGHQPTHLQLVRSSSSPAAAAQVTSFSAFRASSLSYIGSSHLGLPVFWVKKVKPCVRSRGWRDSLVVSVLDLRWRGRGSGLAGIGWSRSNRGPVALCTLGLGLLNPPSLNGR